MGTRKKVIVIGGGIAGLSAGCYLQINGFDADVYEMAPTAGGVTAMWKRKGYTLDGGTNWFPGSGSKLNFYPILNELLDFKNHPLLNFEKFMQVRLRNGSYLDVFTNAEKLRSEMMRIAPEDKKTIDEFIGAVLIASTLQLPIDKTKELFNVYDYLKIALTSVPLGLFFSKWRKITIAQYAQRFSNPNMKQLFQLIFPRHSYFSVLGVMMAIAWMHIESAGYPMGGSEWVISSMCNKLKSLGGRLECSARVREIIVENNSACGVVMQDGTQKKADIVISAADGYSTHFNLLGGKYSPPETKAFFEETPVFPSLIQVSLGVKGDFTEFVHKTVLEYSPSIDCGKDSIDVLQVRFCHFDKGLAPEGCTSIIVHLRAHDYQYWVDLRNNDRKMYTIEKDRITDRVIAILEGHCGPLRKRIEVIDTATPATFIRYNDTYKGSYQSWAPVPKLIGSSLKKTLPNLNNFYMCGQWVEPAGGLPRAIFSARNTVQILCAKKRQKFKTT